MSVYVQPKTRERSGGAVPRAPSKCPNKDPRSVTPISATRFCNPLLQPASATRFCNPLLQPASATRFCNTTSATFRAAQSTVSRLGSSYHPNPPLGLRERLQRMHVDVQCAPHDSSNDRGKQYVTRCFSSSASRSPLSDSLRPPSLNRACAARSRSRAATPPHSPSHPRPARSLSCRSRSTGRITWQRNRST